MGSARKASGCGPRHRLRAGRGDCRIAGWSSWAPSVVACRKTANRGVPETTTGEPLVQGPRESAVAEPLARAGFLLQQIPQRLGDFLVNLAVLLGRNPWRNADIADEELLGLGADGKSAQIRAPREQRFQLRLHVAMGFHDPHASPLTLHCDTFPRCRPA